MAETSYPMLKARGSGQEELSHARGQGSGWEELPQPHAQGQGWQPKGATPRLRSGAGAKTSYPRPEAKGRGREELRHARGQGLWPRQATPCLRPGAEAERSYHTPEGEAVAGRSYPNPTPPVAGRSYPNPTSKARAGGREELPHAQGQGLWRRQATPSSRPGVVAERSYHTPEVRAAAGRS